MFENKKALLLDMNSTFMFGEDRFDEQQDFSICYRQFDGSLSDREVNSIIRRVYRYLDGIYPTERFRECFPSLGKTINQVTKVKLAPTEVNKLINTFAWHERGRIPGQYIDALNKLALQFSLAAVIDIWSPKQLWLEEFERCGIGKLFSALSFSSDHGMVKPSPKPFEWVVEQLGVTKQEALVIGDSVRRDLGGARAAGVDCVLVGGASHPHAVAEFHTLLDFAEYCSTPKASAHIPHIQLSTSRLGPLE